MGLASSQARLLLLVARKSDIEYRGQSINQRRLVLSFHTEQLAKNYTDALSNRKLYIKMGDFSVEASVQNLLNIGILVCQGADAAGIANGTERVGVTQTDPPIAIPYDENDDDNGYASVEEIEAGLRNGKYYLWGTTFDQDGKEKPGVIDWRTNTILQDVLYDEDDERASAEYEYQSLLIHNEDKRLEVELKNLDTQHKAIETEIEAVKKVIDKNIEMSFKTFSA